MRAALAAVACFALVFALGAYVSSRPPVRLDVEGALVRGGAVRAAVFFTTLGRGWAVVLIAFVLLALAASRERALELVALLASQGAAQVAVNLVKLVFHRTRPDDWLVTHELGFSFPSGHATTAVVFFGTLCVLASRGFAHARALDYAIAVAAAICIAGIPWSRLSLGAHYATDVIGGMLFGLGWVAATWALLGVLRATGGPAGLR